MRNLFLKLAGSVALGMFLNLPDTVSSFVNGDRSSTTKVQYTVLWQGSSEIMAGDMVNTQCMV